MTVYSRALPARSLPPRTELPACDAVALNATLAAHEDVTGTLGAFTVVLDHPLGAFRPGQYVSLGAVRDGELVQRPYSLVSLDPSGRRLELFIRRLPDGRFSNLLWSLPLGTRLRVGRVKGLFLLDPADPRPRLMVGTGTGLAPLLAMLDDVAARADRTANVLIHGVSYHAELAFGDRIAGWVGAGLRLDYRPTVSRPTDERNSTWRGLTGRAEAQVSRLLDEAPHMRASVAYLCGNSDMIEACSATLLRAGFRAEDMRAEQFHGPVRDIAPPPR